MDDQVAEPVPSLHPPGSARLGLALMCLFVVASGCSRLPAVTYSALISEIKADNVRFVEVFRTSATVYLRMPSPRSESQGDELRVERLSEEERAALIKLLTKSNVPFEYPDRL